MDETCDDRIIFYHLFTVLCHSDQRRRLCQFCIYRYVYYYSNITCCKHGVLYLKTA